MGFFSDIIDWFRSRRPVPPKPPVPPPPPPSGSVIAELLRLHNEARGLKPKLTLDSRLVKAAQLHADWMAKHNRLSHFEDPGPSHSFDDRARNAGFPMSSGAENIAAGQLTPVEAMNSWMHSAGHKANILGTYRSVGFGTAKSTDGTPYWRAVLAA